MLTYMHTYIHTYIPAQTPVAKLYLYVRCHIGETCSQVCEDFPHANRLCASKRVPCLQGRHNRFCGVCARMYVCMYVWVYVCMYVWKGTAHTRACYALQSVFHVYTAIVIASVVYVRVCMYVCIYVKGSPTR